MLSENIKQLNFEPTRHQAGVNSSLLDLYLANILERIKNIENFTNTSSEHDGVRCVLHLKGDISVSRSYLYRDYRMCTFNNVQPLVDSSHRLQSLFNDSDPEVIAEKLILGMKEITDCTVSKKRVQPKSCCVPYWNANLESKRECEKTQ